jgi:hypothetical protein
MSFHRWVQLIEVILVAGIFGMSYWSLHMSCKKRRVSCEKQRVSCKKQRGPSQEERDEKS